MTLESLEYKRNIHAKKLSLFKNKEGKKSCLWRWNWRWRKRKKKKKEVDVVL